MPRQQSEKKGRPAWKPASTLDVIQKSEDFRYRWTDRDPGNLDRKIAEGWVFVNKETGIPGEHEHPERVADGMPLDTTKTFRELVVMAMPEETAQERDAYYREQTRKQTVGLKDVLKRDLSEAAERSGSSQVAPVDGTIVIE